MHRAPLDAAPPSHANTPSLDHPLVTPAPPLSNIPSSRPAPPLSRPSPARTRDVLCSHTRRLVPRVWASAPYRRRLRLSVRPGLVRLLGRRAPPGRPFAARIGPPIGPRAPLVRLLGRRAPPGRLSAARHSQNQLIQQPLSLARSARCAQPDLTRPLECGGGAQANSGAADGARGRRSRRRIRRRRRRRRRKLGGLCPLGSGSTPCSLSLYTHRGEGTGQGCMQW